MSRSRQGTRTSLGLGLGLGLTSDTSRFAHLHVSRPPGCVMKGKRDSLDHNEFRLRALKIARDRLGAGTRVPFE